MSLTALLDVNVLVALFDPDHVHHEAAHAWFAENRANGWATCPMTQNALVRIVSNPAYSPAGPRADEAARRLDAFTRSGRHAFWADDASLLDSAVYALGRASGHRQLTDVYLLGLAKRHAGRLATFDRSIPLAAVVGATEADRIVLRA